MSNESGPPFDAASNGATSVDEDLQGQVDDLVQRVNQFIDEGQYEPAVDVAARVLDLTRHQLGEDHPNVATSRSDLAWLYQQLGHYLAAEPLYRQALEIYQATLG